MAKLHPSSRTVLELLADFEPAKPVGIRSIATFTSSDSETLVYIGTQSGSLILLSLNSNFPSLSHGSNASTANAGKNVPSHLRSVSVCDSPVDSIHVVADIGRVLVLSDGFMFLMDSLLIQPVKRLSFLKGVTVISRRLRTGDAESLDFSENVSGLVESSSASQRFLMKLGSGIRANGAKARESEHLRDGNRVFAIAAAKKLGVDGVRTMVWIDDSIIIGTSSGYSLISCVSGQCSVLFSLPDPTSMPHLKLLRKEHKISSYVVVASDGKMELYHKKSGVCIQMASVAAEGSGMSVVADAEDASGNLVVVATPSKSLSISLNFNKSQ
ncbi:hypothetical protein CK203_091970 [Vitis vinifera]|uniref:CNH domain-containing protein n=1 Tax=Vitis vinifera TaxID=29760 RepID=A0A438DEW2_VITVI|nr:hypothetical protein CK203_091970 [Vitis vinifera]